MVIDHMAINLNDFKKHVDAMKLKFTSRYLYKAQKQ